MELEFDITGVRGRDRAGVGASVVGAAGGSVNIFRALVSSSVAAATANANAVYGQALSVAIYRPSGHLRARLTLFFIHGGGWNSGSNDTAQTDFRWYANHGWLVISTQYRLATDTDHAAGTIGDQARLTITENYLAHRILRSG